MRSNPVLYLDLDDTILSWASGRPTAAPGAREFVRWAIERFEVRWLTRWCPGGEMEDKLLGDLCKMLQLPTTLFRDVSGFDWAGTESKLNGVAWLEHVVLGRPFVWVEDQHGCGEAERGFLAAHGLQEAHLHCNVTEDAEALQRVHQALAERFASWEKAAA